MNLVKRLCVVFFTVAFVASSSPAQSYQVSHSQQQSNLFSFTECEDAGKCSSWTFNGQRGSGAWGANESGDLTFEQVSINPDRTATVIIHRSDSIGKNAGLVRDYWGTMRNGRISGEYGLPGHRNEPDGVWYAFAAPQPSSHPRTIHFCDQEHCLTLLLENGNYVVQMPNNCCSSSSVWTVFEFTPQRLIMNRRDASGFTSFYKASIAPDGNSTLSGESGNGAYVGDDVVGAMMHGNFRFAWGSQLNSLAGNGPGIREFQPPQQAQQQGMSSVDPNVMLKFLTAVANVIASSNE